MVRDFDEVGGGTAERGRRFIVEGLSHYFFTHTDGLLIWKVYFLEFEQVKIVLRVIDLLCCIMAATARK